METGRRDPEALLRHAKAKEREARLGKLKIYLGAAPGVGKTYTMLSDAITKRSQGLDVVIGVVESHGRSEIESLLKNLEILPRKKINYHGQQLAEFDVDAVLKRNPALVLIDEMAHTNAPGVRHLKRWQDIKEILDRGINVYTTLNVQHIESLNDIISQIIHTHIKETVPDFMIEAADTIELVDLPPEELLKRLNEGKVYIPKQAEIAKGHFFRKGNLIALRELALRVTAERVGTQVLLYRQDLGIKHIWPTKEKILVCVGHGAETNKIVRAAKRMSVHLQADWLAVHVDKPLAKVSETEKKNAIQNLRLAELLGAETRVLIGTSIVWEIMNFAREQNITQIVIGKNIRSKWRNFLFGSLADEIIRNSKEIDVYIITNEAKPRPKESILKEETKKKKTPWLIYLMSVALVGFTTLICALIFSIIAPVNLIMIYLLGVTIVALFGYVGPSILASVLSVLAYDFFFVPPYYEFAISDVEYIVTLTIMLMVAQIISHLAILTRYQVEKARLKERQASALNTLNHQLASYRGQDKLLEVGVRFIGDLFDSEVIGLLPSDAGLTDRARYHTDQVLDPKEKSIAEWVFDLGQSAGFSTDTLPFSNAIYLPLLTSQGAIGVIRVRPNHPDTLNTPEQIRQLETCTFQLALALELDKIQESRKISELQTETDRVKTTLLRAVSHDLRAPLSSVMKMLTNLIEESAELSAREIKVLGIKMLDELEELSRLLNNLLQMTYLDAELVKLAKKPTSLAFIIDDAIKNANKKLGEKTVHVKLPANLQPFLLDEVLMQEVFDNLIDNAIKFTPPQSPIEITVEVRENTVLVSVDDRGPGIMPDEVKRLFEKFYRGRMLTTERGLGLGLAISRSIIKAHGGDMWAENRDDGGAAFKFILPYIVVGIA